MSEWPGHDDVWVSIEQAGRWSWFVTLHTGDSNGLFVSESPPHLVLGRQCAERKAQRILAKARRERQWQAERVEIGRTKVAKPSKPPAGPSCVGDPCECPECEHPR